MIHERIGKSIAKPLRIMPVVYYMGSSNPNLIVLADMASGCVPRIGEHVNITQILDKLLVRPLAGKVSEVNWNIGYSNTAGIGKMTVSAFVIVDESEVCD